MAASRSHSQQTLVKHNTKLERWGIKHTICKRSGDRNR